MGGQSAVRAFVALAVAFLFLGSRGLYETTEGRYAEVAREMVASGSWLEPTLSGRPHWTKPPLAYWAVAAGLETFGMNAWGARLPGAVAFLLTGLLVGALGRRLWGREAGVLAALVFYSSPFPVAAAATVSTDTFLALWVALGLYGYVARDARLLWLGFGLAFLTKGPPGLLPLLPIVVYHLRAGRPFRLFAPVGLLLFAAVACWWYLVVEIRHPGLLAEMIRSEVIGRNLSAASNRNAEWYGPFVVYLPVLLLGGGAWGIWGARAAWRRRFRFDRRGPAALLVLFVAIPVVVFSLSRSRLWLYLLPLYPALALLFARALEIVCRRPAARALPVALVSAILLVLAKGGAAEIRSWRDMAALHRAVEGFAGRGAEVFAFGDESLSGLEFYRRRFLVRFTLDGTEPFARYDGAAGMEAARAAGAVILARGSAAGWLRERAAGIGYREERLPTGWSLFGPGGDGAVLAWFDRLGLADVGDRPFGLLTTGWEVPGNGGGPEVVPCFILEETGERFTILTADLFEKRFPKRPPEGGDRAPPRFEPLDFREWVEAVLDRARGPRDESDPWGCHTWRTMRMTGRLGGGLSAEGELIALAGLSARRGLPDVAAGLLAAARGFADDSRSLAEAAVEEFGAALAGRAMAAFGDVAWDRPDLLRMFERVARRFPDTPRADAARATIARLGEMIAEDREHARSGKALAGLTGEARIAELIYRLRDQNGAQFIWPGGPTVFLSPEFEEGGTAADELVAIGWDAVPALIEALTDERFTRTVGFWRAWVYASYYVVRVGDAALEILQNITRRRFWQGTYSAASMLKDGEAEATRARARAWWEEYRRKGRRQALIDDVREGRDAAMRDLAREFPGDAVPVFLEVATAGLRGSARFNMLSAVSALGDDRLVPFLRREGREGPGLPCRALAARALLRRGESGALPVLVALWREHRADAGDPDVDFGLMDVVECLAFRGAPKTVRVLGEVLRGQPVRTRLLVAEEIGRGLRGSRYRPVWAELPRAIELQALLVSLLGDREETGITHTGGKSYTPVTVGGEAAEALKALRRLPGTGK